MMSNYTKNPNQTIKVEPSLVSQDWHHSRCFACGPDNPRTLGGDFRFNEATGEVDFFYTADEDCIGAPGYLHGGVLATLLDEAQGVLCHHIGHFVMTEKLQLSYHKATELGRPFRIRAWTTAVRRRRLYTRATITGEDGELRVSSRASWYLLPERLCMRMMGLAGAQEVEYYRRLMEVNRKRAKEIRRKIRLRKKREKSHE